MANNLYKAIEIANKAHSKQFDKAGQPYILHPLRLMSQFQQTDEMVVAVLHDVIEDSDVSLDDLTSNGFSRAVVEAIDCLSHRKGERYEEYIKRISTNILARKIKIEDLKDNMDLTRLDSVSDKDLARIEKYHSALRVLLAEC